LLEIVGYWTPEYLQAKFQTLRTFADHRILIAVAEASARKTADLPRGIICYKTVLRPQQVLDRLQGPESV
jgi:predicted nuclease of restriction endonuclease-like RecB superfamily